MLTFVGSQAANQFSQRLCVVPSNIGLSPASAVFAINSFTDVHDAAMVRYATVYGIVERETHRNVNSRAHVSHFVYWVNLLFFSVWISYKRPHDIQEDTRINTPRRQSKDNRDKIPRPPK